MMRITALLLLLAAGSVNAVQLTLTSTLTEADNIGDADEPLAINQQLANPNSDLFAFVNSPFLGEDLYTWGMSNPNAPDFDQPLHARDRTPGPGGVQAGCQLPGAVPECYRVVGLNGGDVGEGAGDGLDELVALPFNFPALGSSYFLTEASLALELTFPTGGTPTTDEILIADPIAVRVPNTDPVERVGLSWRDNRLGNMDLLDVAAGGTALVEFDLLNMNVVRRGVERTIGFGGQLRDGSFIAIYLDDAIVSRATLTVTAVPEPATVSFLMVGLLGLVGRKCARQAKVRP